jgi:hypothetical protein
MLELLHGHVTQSHQSGIRRDTTGNAFVTEHGHDLLEHTCSRGVRSVALLQCGKTLRVKETTPCFQREPLVTLRSKAHIARSSSKSKGVADAVKRPPSHEGGDPRSGVPGERASVLPHGTGGRRQAETRPASGDDSRLGVLVSRRTCQNRVCRPTASLVKELAR